MRTTKEASWANAHDFAVDARRCSIHIVWSPSTLPSRWRDTKTIWAARVSIFRLWFQGFLRSMRIDFGASIISRKSKEFLICGASPYRITSFFTISLTRFIPSKRKQFEWMESKLISRLSFSSPTSGNRESVALCKSENEKLHRTHEKNEFSLWNIIRNFKCLQWVGMVINYQH